MSKESNLKTFNEWSGLGYKINKGSKATRICGLNYFNKSQVTYTRRSNGSRGYHWIGTDPTSRGSLNYDEEYDEDHYTNNPLFCDYLGRKY